MRRPRKGSNDNYRLKQIPGKTDTAPARIFFPDLSESRTEKRFKLFHLNFDHLDPLDSLHIFSLFKQSILPALFRLSLRTFLSSATGGFGSSENRSPWEGFRKVHFSVGGRF